MSVQIEKVYYGKTHDMVVKIIKLRQLSGISGLRVQDLVKVLPISEAQLRMIGTLEDAKFRVMGDEVGLTWDY